VNNLSIEKAGEIVCEKFPKILPRLIRNKTLQDNLIDTSIKILQQIDSDQLEGRKPATIAGSCLFLSGIIHSVPIAKGTISKNFGISVKSIYKISNLIRQSLLKNKAEVTRKFLSYLE